MCGLKGSPASPKLSRPYYGDPLDLLGDGLEPTVELVVLASRAHVVKYRKEILQHTLNRHLASKITVAVDAACSSRTRLGVAEDQTSAPRERP